MAITEQAGNAAVAVPVVEGPLINAMLNQETAILQVNYNGQQGEVAQPVVFELNDEGGARDPALIRSIAQEALRSGTVRGMDAIPDADLTDFPVRAYPSRDGLPNRFSVTEKVEYGQV